VLADALEKAERYSGIVNEGISFQFRAGHETVITFNPIHAERRSDLHQSEFWLTSLVRICRQLTNRRLLPSRIRVVHHRRKASSQLTSFLGREVEFGSAADEVTFPAAVQYMPVVTADPYLGKLLAKYSDEAIAHRKTDPNTLRPSLENAIAVLLPHGKAKAGEVARRLGMSHRTLARRLSSAGLTFSEVADELRADLARRYLKEEGLTVSRIAWLLGYREVSAFTHAFKRWTGETPRQARARGETLIPPMNPVRKTMRHRRGSKLAPDVRRARAAG
jgi:AraC-like DNA-binding protein